MAATRGQKKGLAVNRTRGGKTTKIMAVVDRNGLPVAAGIAGGAEHETKRVAATIKSRLCRKKPTRIIGDRAYDSDPLDAALADLGIELISRHRRDRTSKKHKMADVCVVTAIDGNSNNFFSWIHNFRRITER